MIIGERTCVTIAVGMVSLVAVVSGSLAQLGRADPQHGQELAARLCVNCHVIDKHPTTQMRTDVPSFPVIASRDGATAEYIAGRIVVPHPAMPGVSLTAAEIRDIVSYIISLK